VAAPVPPYNANVDEIIYGLDFGFNNPSALMECCLRDQTPFIRELIYESRLTNGQLIDRMNALNLDKDLPYYCDSAEPARIEELQQAGYNAIPADKSVKDGIDYVKRRRLYIDPASTNTLNEIPAYSYRKKGEQVLDEPVKFRDHAMDAIRYALYTHSKNPQGEFILLSGGSGAET
jgi:phage terminase large subunit